MKYVLLLVGLLLSGLQACHDEARQLCEEIEEGLLYDDLAKVQSGLNPWLEAWPPQPTEEDPVGHRQNLNDFMDKLNEVCDLEASLVCYACIETFPLQSEVRVRIDSSGQRVDRILDITTPDSLVMRVNRIHS